MRREKTRGNVLNCAGPGDRKRNKFQSADFNADDILQNWQKKGGKHTSDR